MAVYTIGYGGTKFPDFIALLLQQGVTLVVDVRRFPLSSSPESSRESLELSLPRWGLGYMSMGETLGGMRRGGYPGHMETEAYKRGLAAALGIPPPPRDRLPKVL